MAVETLVAGAANLLAGVFLIPQILRLARTGDTAGVSSTWAAFGALTNTTWVIYLAMIGLWAAAIAPALAVLAYTITVRFLVRGDFRRSWIWLSGLYAFLFSVVAGLGGTDALGPVLALTPVVQLAPGMTSVFREAHPTGVSPVTWGLGLCEAVLWGVYGWLVSDMALVGYGLVTCAGSILILGRLIATRPRLAYGVLRL